MRNERKTEGLVRDAMRRHGYFDIEDLRIEEQKSEDPRIQKLLKSASKAGNGAGQPEFLVSSHRTNLLIVIECKADPKKHESSTGDRYAEFAVDGALLYSSYLSKYFDVLAIAVSGQTEQELTVSHYLQLRGDKRGLPVFGRQLLSYDDYLTGYSSDPRKFNQDYERLLAYTRELNEILHAKKVKESQRSLLISGILIALKSRAFEASYRQHSTAKRLATTLVNTVLDELSDAELSPSKLDSLRQGFSFIKTHATLSTDKTFLEDLISGIDQNINSFRRTHLYFDTLGQFYIEFLRYANNDKGLGIVLTPPHITELFCDLANVSSDSVVFDNTCGTGGFLISAMQKMVADAQGDSTKITSIQKRQLVGIEFQDDIYSLAVTNMVLHDDGKSSILQGDCFGLSDSVRASYSPTVGLLNPPYRSKKSDKEELEFVLNNLQTLTVGGVCVAIVPITCVLARESTGLLMKRLLMKKHTLEAVLSMPPELFHNSKVGVVTAAIVITAHVPHAPDKKTWLAYCRHDGFSKRKHLGRLDVEGLWPAIKKSWLVAFKNRETLKGLSVSTVLRPEDEWCAEAYMETDYATLSEADFERELKKYVAFRILKDDRDAETEEAE